MAKVFINAGHCIGIDSGAVNSNLNEQEAVLAMKISEGVKYYLEKVGYNCKLLQDDSLNYVCSEANSFEADVFVSIHLNAFNKKAEGTETLVYNLYGKSLALAECIQNELVQTLGTVDRGIKERKNLAVLRLTAMPAVLVEVGFIDNDKECRMILDSLDEIAKAIARGITDYFKELG